MIFPDINLLIYAYNSDAIHHNAARTWWESVLTQEKPVALCWSVILGFIRLTTSRQVLQKPCTTNESLAIVNEWLNWPSIEILHPGPKHFEILSDLLKSNGIVASLTSDAHLAAIALEHNLILYSNDNDFARFEGLKWKNPLRKSQRPH